MTDAPEAIPPSSAKAVLHRWFVQYNPLYLVSATLVLVGVIQLMEATTVRGGVLGQLSSTAVAEAYAWALIGGAAVLTRRGLWRPAVMLALITALYQCDLTLQTERSVYLGTAGMAASGLWLVSFVAKLRALAWAMQFRLSRSALGVPVFGAIGVTSIPWIVSAFPGRMATSIVGLLVFWIIAAGLWTGRRTYAQHVRSAWARTVAGRSARVVWCGWCLAVVVHVLFLAEHGPGLDRAILVPAMLVLFTRGFQSEARVWPWLAGILLLVGLLMPEHFAATAVMVATAFVLRALRAPTPVPVKPQQRDPYRTDPDERPRWPTWTLAPSSPAAIERLLVAAWTSLYLAAWTVGWEGGAWPDHVAWLDVAFLAFGAAWVWRRRSGRALVPVVASAAHWILVAGVFPTPQSTLQWSLTTIGLGFGLLLAGLGLSVRWRPR